MKNQSIVRGWIAAAAIVVPLMLVGARAHAEITLYSQPPVFPTSSGLFAWTSDTDTTPSGSGAIYHTFDDFDLASSGTVDAVTFQGFNFDNNTLGADSQPTSFTVDFSTDNGGVPGTVLSTDTVSYTSSVAGTTDFFGNSQTETVYNYAATINPVDLAGGTKYWVSIIGNDPLPDLFTWSQGTGGDGTSYQEDFHDSNSGSRITDRAFSLLGSVPEPAPTTAVGLGVLLLGTLLLKKRQDVRRQAEGRTDQI